MRKSVKLFGNKRNATRLKKDSDGTQRKRKLSGVQRGLLLLAGSVLILSLTVFAVYRDFVKPVEIERPISEENEFRPPTVVEIETQIDETSGQEIQVEIEVPASRKSGFYNVLVLGTDDDGIRTDTIMIARLNVTDHTVALMSIPRDTLIEYSPLNVPKINGVYGYAGTGEKGIKALKGQLAKLLGFEVDAYAVVNLKAFVELVDLVGGVEFNVPMRMYYSDPTQDLYIDLQAGLQTLDGEKAMELVRFRKGYASQDIQRTQVQQDFIQALAKKCLSVVNLTKVGEMADIFAKHVKTDLSVGNIAYFGQELLKCDFENMYSYTLEGEGIYWKGVSYYAIYLHNTLEAVNGYFNPYDTDITADHVTILTPEYIRAVQAAEKAQEEPEEIPEEELPEEEEILPEEQPTEDEEFPLEEEEVLPESDDPLMPELPTDQWVELPEEELWSE